ncbi:unnamed protein product, partial [Brassica oleracea var. botrytis]
WRLLQLLSSPPPLGFFSQPSLRFHLSPSLSFQLSHLLPHSLLSGLLDPLPSPQSAPLLSLHELIIRLGSLPWSLALCIQFYWRFIVSTCDGLVSVVVYGDQEKPALITYPNVALNYLSCFQGLFLCPEAVSLLLHNFCIYHISPPGHEVCR